MNRSTLKAGEDPLHLVARLATRLKTYWLRLTYPFYAFGRGARVTLSCDIPRPMCPEMSIGDGVYLAQEVWLTVIPGGQDHLHPKLILGAGCSVGKRTSISAHNSVVIEQDVLIGPSVVIMDYNHQFSDPDTPVIRQGINEGGRVIIERGSWIGQGAAILCGRGKLIIGRNSVVGANSVVTHSFPPFSVIAGNPARLIRKYDPQTNSWVRAPELGEDVSVGNAF